ncbi:hypothetical protein [Streptomyces uncialis]|uniref:Lipoprotein n=1 Tax=Streptomyces uncialis TaxID=1048205 RepID=A0A1Q4UXE3_9ACTN|nr:hypothetical protein [Streptomyces uncialis]OKH90231.1 hypothetical protein AB852_35760 [Streptomyces uncialis]WST71874.1 hypothetical protein OG268_33375 [Streptomyces uncialis]WTE09442.1 hypothetical protein OG924_03375 [Streptomyces uncialis]
MRTRSALLTIATLSAALVACGTEGGGTVESGSSTAAQAGSSAPAGTTKASLPVPGPDGRYEQTWKRATADTTCDQFRQQMTPEERWVMAAEVLTDERGDGAEAPAQQEISRFETDLNVACQDTSTAESVMTEVGSTLYLLDQTYKP